VPASCAGAAAPLPAPVAAHRTRTTQEQNAGRREQWSGRREQWKRGADARRRDQWMAASGGRAVETGEALGLAGTAWEGELGRWVPSWP
jgi:hypothetical protein